MRRQFVHRMLGSTRQHGCWLETVGERGSPGWMVVLDVVCLLCAQKEMHLNKQLNPYEGFHKLVYPKWMVYNGKPC